MELNKIIAWYKIVRFLPYKLINTLPKLKIKLRRSWSLLWWQRSRLQIKRKMFNKWKWLKNIYFLFIIALTLFSLYWTWNYSLYCEIYRTDTLAIGISSKCFGGLTWQGLIFPQATVQFLELLFSSSSYCPVSSSYCPV